MPNLNFQYALSPTAPQVKQLNRQLWQCRQQYNRAVRTFRNLQSQLGRGQVEYVLNKVLGMDKNDRQGNRQKAIQSRQERFPGKTGKDLSRLHDLCTLFGKSFPIEERHLDIAVLQEELSAPLAIELCQMRMYRRQMRDWFRRRKLSRKGEDVEAGAFPKKEGDTPLYYALRRACVLYAGFEAKTYLDRGFPSAKGTFRSEVRFEVSASKTKARFERACNPSAEQRKHGNTGMPRFKNARTGTSFSCQIRSPAGSLLRQVQAGWQIRLKMLPEGLQWVPIILHRPLPEGCELCKLVIQKDAGKWLATLALEVSEDVYRLPAGDPKYFAGLNPAEKPAITVAMFNQEQQALSYKIFDWSPLEKALEELEKLQQRMVSLRGPDRRKGQRPSRRWKQRADQVGRLHAHIRRQRKNMHHQISRWLARFGRVAIGDWEPVREKGERPGPDGIVSKRREGRDRGIASLRRLVEEKAQRAGMELVDVWAEEYYTTQTCSVCQQKTGPKGKEELHIRQWDCPVCGTHHDRGENAAWNILRWTLIEPPKEKEELADG